MHPSGVRECKEVELPKTSPVLVCALSTEEHHEDSKAQSGKIKVVACTAKAKPHTILPVN
jgi:hypothetical protein